MSPTDIQFLDSIRKVADRPGMYRLRFVRDFIIFLFGVEYARAGQTFLSSETFFNWMKKRYRVPSGLHWESKVVERFPDGDEGIKKLMAVLEKYAQEY